MHCIGAVLEIQITIITVTRKHNFFTTHVKTAMVLYIVGLGTCTRTCGRLHVGMCHARGVPYPVLGVDDIGERSLGGGSPLVQGAGDRGTVFGEGGMGGGGGRRGELEGGGGGGGGRRGLGIFL